MVESEEENKINTHLLLIKNLDKLLCDSTVDHHKRFNCRNCLNYFTKKEKLEKHELYCYEKEHVSTDEYPEKGSIVEYKNF